MTARILAALDGLLCVYKPSEMSVSGLKKYIVRKVCEDGNNATRIARLPIIKIPIVEPHPETGASIVVGEREQPDYMMHPLVSGEIFRPEDIQLEELQYMETSTSGVCLLGVNAGCDELPSIMARSFVNSYRLECMLGRETMRHDIKGRVTLKADFEHVTHHRMAKLLSRVQAQYRRSAFESAEVDLQSEEAFQLARKGLPRSQLPGSQIMYSINIDSFKPPYFALHLQASGETDEFLRHFVHEVGVSLGSTACCVRLQRQSIGPLLAEHALLEKQISLQNIVRNIAMCRKIISASKADARVVGESEGEEYSPPRDVLDGVGVGRPDTDYDAMRPAWPRNYN